jgi:hypothetical protein
MGLDFKRACVPGDLRTTRFIDACIMTEADLKMKVWLLAHVAVVGQLYREAQNWLSSWVTTAGGTALLLGLGNWAVRRATRRVDEGRLAHVLRTYAADATPPSEVPADTE